MMQKEEFSRYLLERIMDYMPEEYAGAKAEIMPVKKMNGVVLHGLRILKEETQITPIFYVNDLYRKLQDGMSVQDICREVADSYVLAMEDSRDLRMTDFTNFDLHKDHVYVQLVSRSLNQELLKTCPHKTELDLAKIYYVELGSGATTKVTGEMQRQWGISAEELERIAMKNTIEKKEAFLQPMLISMIDFRQCEVNYLQEENLPGDSMFVLTNKDKCFGAAALIYPEVKERIADMIGGDYTILPSSVHECIILKETSMDNYTLGKMVREVNRTSVDEKEWLSDCAYRYYAEDRKLEILPGSKPREKEAQR